MVSTEEKRKKILEFLSKKFQEDPSHYVFQKDVVDGSGLEYNDVKGECRMMDEEELIKKSLIPDYGIAYIIKSKGIEELNTTYNPEYKKKIDEEMKNQLSQQIEERKKKEKIDQDVVDSTKKQAKWQKYGVIAAIVIGFVALVIAIFKP